MTSVRRRVPCKQRARKEEEEETEIEPGNRQVKNIEMYRGKEI